MESLKPDCADALRRKTLQSLRVALSSTLSPVQFESNSCGIAPISRNFKSNPSRFLCTSDCVAEGETFEPSVPFLNDLNGDVSALKRDRRKCPAQFRRQALRPFSPEGIRAVRF